MLSAAGNSEGRGHVRGADADDGGGEGGGADRPGRGVEGARRSSLD